MERLGRWRYVGRMTGPIFMASVMVRAIGGLETKESVEACSISTVVRLIRFLPEKHALS